MAGGATLLPVSPCTWGQVGCSGSGISWPATPPQHEPAPQQHVAVGPFTLQPHRRTVSPLRHNDRIAKRADTLRQHKRQHAHRPRRRGGVSVEGV